MMKPNRLDDIFQIYRGIPIICDLYIGMDFSSMVEKLKILYNYRIRHYYDYPADLIYRMGIDVNYEMFEESKSLKSISLSFSKSTSGNDVNFLKQYIKEKYYYRRFDEFIQRDADNKVLAYMIDIYNEFFHFTIYSNEDSTLTVQLRAADLDESIYEAIIRICFNREIDEAFVENLCYKSNKGIITNSIGDVDNYLCINKLINDNDCESYFSGLLNFYRYGSDTQNAKYNELRRRYDTFLDGFRDYMMMCNYTYKKGDDIFNDINNACNQFLDLWNTPDSV